MSDSDLFDIIIEQLLSGVRNDGRIISFRYRIQHGGKLTKIINMRKQFNENLTEILHINLYGTEDDFRENLNDLMDTIPIIECTHADDFDYFEKQICEHIRTFSVKQQID